MVLARREGGKVSFRLREGVGERVPRAPWRIEWGGGASIENPHYQRVHYCQLLVRPKPLCGGAREQPCGESAFHDAAREVLDVMRGNRPPESSPASGLLRTLAT